SLVRSCPRQPISIRPRDWSWNAWPGRSVSDASRGDQSACRTWSRFSSSAMTPKREPAVPPSTEEASPSLPALLGQIDAIAEGAPDTDTVTTGFPSLDRSLGGGFRRGDLAILGGDVGSGKSAFALAVALRSAERHSVAFFSGEMTPQRLMERVLAIEGRVRVDELRQGALDELSRSRVGAAAVRLRERLPRFGKLSLDSDDGLPD